MKHVSDEDDMTLEPFPIAMSTTCTENGANVGWWTNEEDDWHWPGDRDVDCPQLSVGRERVTRCNDVNIGCDLAHTIHSMGSQCENIMIWSR